MDYILRNVPEPEWQQLQALQKMDKSFASTYLRACVFYHKLILEFFQNDALKQVSETKPEENDNVI